MLSRLYQKGEKAIKKVWLANQKPWTVNMEHRLLGLVGPEKPVIQYITKEAARISWENKKSPCLAGRA